MPCQMDYALLTALVCALCPSTVPASACILLTCPLSLACEQTQGQMGIVAKSLGIKEHEAIDVARVHTLRPEP